MNALKNLSLASLVALTGLAMLPNCSPVEPVPLDNVGQAESSIVVFQQENTCVTLFAGQTINAGSVCANMDNEVDTSAVCGAGATGAMEVTYTTTGGWELQEAHLAVGDDFADIPVTKSGMPKIGNFQFNSGNITGATSHSFIVPLCQLGLDGSREVCSPVTAYLAAHVAVRKANGNGTYQTETGWGDGDRFVARGSWAEYFNLGLECTKEVEPPPPPPVDCETAFAIGDQCLLSIDQLPLPSGDGKADFNRWGWREQIDGSYSANLWAGAAKCDTSKGTRVGTINVTVNANGTITVVYATEGGFVMDETHLYIGDNLPLLDPSDPSSITVAPGQYTEVHDGDGSEDGKIAPLSPTSDSYTLAGSVGDYLIAHARVCGPFPAK